MDLDAQGMAAQAERYLAWRAATGASPLTVRGCRYVFGYFAQWCEERGVTRVTEVTRALVERYQRWLYQFRRENGAPLSLYTQTRRLEVLKGFFRWLVRNNLVLYNPAADLELPRMGQRLPRQVLTADEAERVLAVPDTESILGLRDRAILETLYSTGVRRLEVVRLELYDLEPDRGTVLVREGKGRKDRVVPIGDRALGWVNRYVVDSRPALLRSLTTDALFLSSESGGPLSTQRVAEMVRGCVRASGVPKRGACHLLRHTMATLMLENGADVRFIQQLLGHARLSTTEIYTHVSIRKLKEVHAATHPAQVGVLERPSSPGWSKDREQLLRSLEEEAAQEGEKRG